MALMECYECEAEISDKALSCPHCGAPSKNHLGKAILDKQKSELEKKTKARTKAREDWLEKERLESLIAIFCILSLIIPIFAFFSITWSITVHRKDMDQGGHLFTSIGFFIAGIVFWMLYVMG